MKHQHTTLNSNDIGKIFTNHTTERTETLVISTTTTIQLCSAITYYRILRTQKALTPIMIIIIITFHLLSQKYHNLILYALWIIKLGSINISRKKKKILHEEIGLNSGLSFKYIKRRYYKHHFYYIIIIVFSNCCTPFHRAYALPVSFSRHYMKNKTPSLVKWWNQFALCNERDLWREGCLSETD